MVRRSIVVRLVPGPDGSKEQTNESLLACFRAKCRGTAGLTTKKMEAGATAFTLERGQDQK